MKTSTFLFLLIPLLGNAQIIKAPNDIKNVIRKEPLKVTKENTTPGNKIKIKPVNSSNSPILVSENQSKNQQILLNASVENSALFRPNLFYKIENPNNDFDNKNAKQKFDFFIGEYRYDLQKGDQPYWELDFLWTNIPYTAKKARLDISQQPFPVGNQTKAYGIIESHVVNLSPNNKDSISFRIQYREKLRLAQIGKKLLGNLGKLSDSNPNNQNNLKEIRVKNEVNSTVPVKEYRKNITSLSDVDTQMLSDEASFGTYFVRLTALDASGNPVGNAGNTIKIVPKIYSFPPLPAPSSEDSLQTDYEVTRIEYTPMHDEEIAYNLCVQVTGYNDDYPQNIVDAFKSKYPIGSIICPSPPSEPSWYEKAFSAVGGVVEVVANGSSKVYSDTKNYLKDKFNEYLCNYDPVVSLNRKAIEEAGVIKKDVDKGCSMVADATFEAAMTYAGVPPSIPNYDELSKMAKGEVVSLMIQKASEESGMPCGEDCQKLIIDNYDKVIDDSSKKNMQTAGFMYFKPDPRSMYRNPYVKIEVTRKRNSQKGKPIITSLKFTPEVSKEFTINTNGTTRKEVITTQLNYEKVELPIPYLKNVGDKITLFAVLTPKQAYMRFNCLDNSPMEIVNYQPKCNGINIGEYSPLPRGYSGYSFMKNNSRIKILDQYTKIKKNAGVQNEFRHDE